MALMRHYGIFVRKNPAVLDHILQRRGTLPGIFFRSVGHLTPVNTIEYTGRKLVGYSMLQMYMVVADVENYKKFVPYCKQSTVFLREKDFLKAKLVIGFPPIVETYVSAVTLKKPNLVQAENSEGKLFHHLTSRWKFQPGLPKNNQTCVTDFFISFKFKSVIHSKLATLFFDEIVKKMEKAFLDEALRRYGEPSIRTQEIASKS